MCSIAANSNNLILFVLSAVFHFHDLIFYIIGLLFFLFRTCRPLKGVNNIFMLEKYFHIEYLTDFQRNNSFLDDFTNAKSFVLFNIFSFSFF